MDDFLGLGLIGVVYGLSVLLSAWGFLAVFFAAVALRQTEQAAGAGRRHRAVAGMPDREKKSTPPTREPPQTVSEGSLVFKEHLERLSEVLLILLLGGTMFLDSWSWRAVGLAAVPVRRRPPAQRPRRAAGHPEVVAITRHGRLVRGPRHRLAVLPDVRDRARAAEGTRSRTHPHDPDRGDAVDPGPRHQRQAADGTFLEPAQAKENVIEVRRLLHEAMPACTHRATLITFHDFPWWSSLSCL
jgi:hypothetical protein